ncbi:PIR Superfamily Protein [Plasmodium ovale wallikeri]|uniref:PIR Superfamily Protein n=1 Tax=Plasmodium ovale wallikeri TaxID=864142 RepID=A0A1A9ANS0_PLAOA|nr:PIR Superfamily Protein [Plasmodium ovale wallikeri]SBT59452.1 PIR Superfamily Protein [Plasmodium ovale wallikeri]
MINYTDFIKYTSYIKKIYYKLYRDCCFLYICYDEYFECNSKYNPSNVISIIKGENEVSDGHKKNSYKKSREGVRNTPMTTAADGSMQIS